MFPVMENVTAVTFLLSGDSVRWWQKGKKE